MASGLQKRRLASGLSWMAAMTLAIVPSGCLVTDVLEERPGYDAGSNHPPRLEEASVTPPHWEIVRLRKDGLDEDSSGCQKTLRIGVVHDEDVDDALVARWFIDYWDDDRIIEEDKLAKTGKPERIGPDFAISPARFEQPGIHVVMVVVSDEFAGGSDFTQPMEGKAAVSQTWTVDTTESGNCPTPDGGYL